MEEVKDFSKLNLTDDEATEVRKLVFPELITTHKEISEFKDYLIKLEKANESDIVAIWPREPDVPDYKSMSVHMVTKWKETRANPIVFINRLDPGNKRLFAGHFGAYAGLEWQRVHNFFVTVNCCLLPHDGKFESAIKYYLSLSEEKQKELVEKSNKRQ
jgi:hypothetical protein